MSRVREEDCTVPSVLGEVSMVLNICTSLDVVLFDMMIEIYFERVRRKEGEGLVLILRE